jgi:hypothetical protein
MTAFKHSLYSSVVCGLDFAISLSTGILQTFNQSLFLLVGCRIPKQVSIVLVTMPLASGRYCGKLGSMLVSELARSDVVAAS